MKDVKKQEVDVLKERIWANYLSISHSSLVERLAKVTQMVTFPTNSMTRTRLSHTNDLLWLVETVSHELNMFTKLGQAISLGHDIGHVPFGHDGERIIKSYLREDFTHGWMGVRLLKIMGFNLEYWVAYGIEFHSDGDLKLNKTISYKKEERRKRFCDLVAILDDVACACSDCFDVIMEYSDSDNDEMRDIAKKAQELIEGVLKSMDIQEESLEDAHQKILADFAQNIIENTGEKQGIFMSEGYLQIFKMMKKFIYDEFHSSKYILDLRKECTDKLKLVIKEVERIIEEQDFDSVIGKEVEAHLGIVRYTGEESLQQKVVDFICTKTDIEIMIYAERLS